MAQPDQNQPEHQYERRVVYETTHTESTKNSGLTIALVATVALILIVWLAMQVF